MRFLIIGGGWSGLATAVTLCQNGHQVELVEAANQLGGRARNVTWQNSLVDNGQHLMIGAYQNMLSMLKTINVDESDIFERLPLDLTIYDAEYPPLSLSSHAWLPWPLSVAYNLFKTVGITGLLQVRRLQSQINKIKSSSDCSVSEWLQQAGQSSRLIRQLWEPLCLGALNTPISQASAHLFATVLEQSLGQDKSYADLLIPRKPLGDVFPSAAAIFIQHHHGKIRLQTRISNLVSADNKIIGARTDKDEIIYADHVIVATSPSQAAAITSPWLDLSSFAEYPIATIYLRYPAHYRLPKPIIGMTGTLSQWLFDRSEQTPGLFAVVISGPGTHQSLNKTDLVKQVCHEIHTLLPQLPVNADDSFVIREKRATFASVAGIQQKRPDISTKINGLWLTGDYVHNAFPATLEGAIVNGITCAHRLMQRV